MKARPKSIPVPGRTKAPAKIFRGANLASSIAITENLEFFCLVRHGTPNTRLGTRSPSSNAKIFVPFGDIFLIISFASSGETAIKRTH